jgi:hypothetical protein
MIHFEGFFESLTEIFNKLFPGCPLGVHTRNLQDPSDPPQPVPLNGGSVMRLHPGYPLKTWPSKITFTKTTHFRPKQIHVNAYLFWDKLGLVGGCSTCPWAHSPKVAGSNPGFKSSPLSMISRASDALYAVRVCSSNLSRACTIRVRTSKRFE